MTDSEEDATNRASVVLVVEDEFLIRDMIATYLRDVGYRVIEASQAADAVALFSSGEPIDVVFTDIRMPGEMDGVMLAQWIKREHDDVPVILTSGTTKLKAGDPEHFVAKPYRLADVASLIAQIVEQERTRCRASPDVQAPRRQRPRY